MTWDSNNNNNVVRNMRQAIVVLAEFIVLRGVLTEAHSWMKSGYLLSKTPAPDFLWSIIRSHCRPADTGNDGEDCDHCNLLPPVQRVAVVKDGAKYSVINLMTSDSPFLCLWACLIYWQIWKRISMNISIRWHLRCHFKTKKHVLFLSKSHCRVFHCFLVVIVKQYVTSM